MKIQFALILAALCLVTTLLADFRLVVADEVPPAPVNVKPPELVTPLAQAALDAKSEYAPVDPSRVAEARQRVANGLARLQRFLDRGTPQQRDGWSEFLQLASLNEEVAGAGVPRWQPLLTSYNQFNSGESGLKLKPFEEVRKSLESYLELLQLTETAEGRMEIGLDELRQQVSQFERYLSRGGEQKETGWKRYLGWPKLSAGLSDQPSPDDLLTVYRKLTDPDVSGLDRPAFRRLARSLGKYLELEQMNRSANARELFGRRLDRLAATLNKHSNAPDNGSSADLSGHLRWLDATGYLPTLASRVRKDLSRPNVLFTVSGEAVTERVSRSVNECQPVQRCFEGSRVRGMATTDGFVYGVLIPSDRSVLLDIRLDGTTRTNTVAQQRKVYVSTVGRTQVSATKRLSITPEAIQTWPAVASACTSQATTGICIGRQCQVGNRLIRRVADRRAQESRGRAQNEQSQEARRTVARQMDEQVAEMIAQADTQREEFSQRYDVNVREFYDDAVMRSTAHEVLGQAKVTAGDYLGAPTAPPAFATSGEAKLQLHQSAVNNVLADVLGGVKIDSDNIVKMLEDNGMPVPEELRPATGTDEDGSDAEEDEWWSLTFDVAQPATVTFEDDQLRIAIRGRRFERGAQSITEPIEISANYRLEKSAGNQLVAVREGEVQVDFVRSPGRLSTKQITYKTFIKRKTGSLFADDFTVDSLPEGDFSDRLRDVVLTEIDASQGWITASMDLPPGSALP